MFFSRLILFYERKYPLSDITYDYKDFAAKFREIFDPITSQMQPPGTRPN
jgi:hypothetical protein